MYLATLLLAVPAFPTWAQVTTPADPAPAPSSESVDAANQAYHEWLKGLPADYGGPMHVDFAVKGKTNFLDEFSSESVNFDLRMVSDIQDIHRMRHTFTGSIREAGGGQSIEFSATIMMDGTNFWLLIKANDDDFIPAGGFLAKGDQKMLEELYHLYIEAVPAMMSLMEQEGLGMDAGLISSTMNSAMAMMPKEIGGYLHPAAYFRSTAPALGCRTFQREGDSVLAEMYLDLSPGSMFGDMIASFDEMFSGILEEEGFDFGDMMHKMFESFLMQTEFDAATGVTTGIAMDWKFDFADVGLEEEGGSLHLVVDGTGSVQQLEAIDESLFAAPKSADKAMDVTMFLQMAKSQLEGMMSEVAGEEEDMAF
jgi:hypothetical protein